MSDKKSPDAPEGASRNNTISLEQAAKLLKKSPQFVMQLRRDGWIPPPPYTVVGVVHGYVDYKEDADRRATKSAGESRVKDARAEEIEMRILEKSNALLRNAQQEIVALVDVYGGPLRSDLLSIPARVTKDLPLRRRIENEINGAFGAAAKRLANELARESEALSPVASPAADNARPVGKGKPGVRPRVRRARAA
jgi:hypothetical protein